MRHLVILFVLFQDFPLGGWSLERSVDGEPPVIYKFTPKYVLKTGSYVTVSPDAWESETQQSVTFDDFDNIPDLDSAFKISF